MIGPEKLSVIRAKVRESFQKSDAEFLKWFDEQVEAAGKRRDGNQTALDSLRLLRDALLRESRRPAPRRKSQRMAGNPQAHGSR